MRLLSKQNGSSSMADSRMLTALSTILWPKISGLAALKSSQSSSFQLSLSLPLPTYVSEGQDWRKLKTSLSQPSGTCLSPHLTSQRNAAMKTRFLNKTLSALKPGSIRHLVAFSLPRTRLTLGTKRLSIWLKEFTSSVPSLVLSPTACAAHTITWQSFSKSRVKFKKQRHFSKRSFKFGRNSFLKTISTKCRNTPIHRLSRSTTRRQTSICVTCWFSSKWNSASTTL